MIRQEVAKVIATSSGANFESELVSQELRATEIIQRLDIQSFFDLLGKQFPQDSTAIIASLESEQMVRKLGSNFAITNLGAMLFAKDIRLT